MVNYSKSDFVSYLIKGQLREAVNYLSQFSEKHELYVKYINIFEKAQYFQNKTS